MELISALILLFAGIIAGLYGSSVGSGALVSFPALILTGMPVSIAIATNRFGAIFLELASTIRFYREGKLNFKLGLILGAIASVGSIIGTNIVVAIQERYLNIIVAVVFVIIFIIFMMNTKLGMNENTKIKKNYIMISVLTFLLGIYGGFFGGGFGTFIMFILITSGFTFLQGAGIGRVVGLMMSAISTIVFAINGYIDYQKGIFLGLGMAIGSWIGVKIAIDKGNKYIKTLLIVVIIITVIKLILRFLNISLF